jgi:hypothetical protein
MAKKETGFAMLYSIRRTSLPAFGGVQSIVISADKDFAGCKPTCALEADMTPQNLDVCSTPESGYQAGGLRCPLCAINGHRKRHRSGSLIDSVSAGVVERVGFLLGITQG